MSGTGRDRQQLRIGSIEAVSPTLAELLRSCKLRAGLSRAEGIAPFTLGNPKAWLGTAYHEVLAAAGGHKGGNLNQAATTAWEAAIDREYQRAKIHPLDRRFGAPETWPGFHLIAAMARVRAQEFAIAISLVAGDRQGTTDASAGIHREERFSGAGGKIVGRPDVVRPDEVIDFKSGAVHEDEDQEQLRPSYVSQLRLYAFLVKEALGWWPRRGVLVPMVGPPVEIEIDPHVCEEEANDAVRLLDDYNALVCKGSDSTELASPSPGACRWCPFQAICPAFWKAVTPDWLDELGTAVIMGTICETPQSIHWGAALSIAIDVRGGTEDSQKVLELSPVKLETQTVAKHIQKGDEVRVTGMLRRPDGTVRMTGRTIFFNVKDLPTIVAGGHSDA